MNSDSKRMSSNEETMEYMNDDSIQKVKQKIVDRSKVLYGC